MNHENGNKTNPDHHEMAMHAVDVAQDLHECIALIRRACFARHAPDKAQYCALVLARENGGMVKFPGLRTPGIDWTNANLEGILL